MFTFSEIHDAFLFVNSAEEGMNRAILCKDTGLIFFRSEWGDINEMDDEKLYCDEFVEIPHKNELDLGQNLVFEFHDFLTEKRNETDEKYDCSYSLLLWVFSRLMVEGGISEDDLRCLMKALLTAHSMAKFDSGTQCARQGPPQSQRSRQIRHS